MSPPLTASWTDIQTVLLMVVSPSAWPYTMPDGGCSPAVERSAKDAWWRASAGRRAPRVARDPDVGVRAQDDAVTRVVQDRLALAPVLDEARIAGG